jgi:hypothetical protein
LTVTYAGFSGESVLLEELHKRGMAQAMVAPSLRAGDGLLIAWHAIDGITCLGSPNDGTRSAWRPQRPSGIRAS